MSALRRFIEDRPAFRGTNRGNQGPSDADFEPASYGEYNRDFNFDQSYDHGNMERGAYRQGYSQGDYSRGYGLDDGERSWGSNRGYEGYGPRYSRGSDRNLENFGQRRGMDRGRNNEADYRPHYARRTPYPERTRSDLRRGTIYDRSRRPNRGNYKLNPNWQDEFVPRNGPDAGRAG